MDRKCLKRSLRTCVLLLGLLSLLFTTGCVGIYNNSALFKYSGPKEGMDELTMLQTYGTPSFSTEVGNQKVYMYKVRDNLYIILVGIFDGADIVVTCENGKVTKVSRVERPKTFSLFNPNVWADTK